MAVEVEKAKLGEIIDTLKPLTPREFRMVSLLESVIQDTLHGKVWVDKWPDYSVVLHVKGKEMMKCFVYLKSADEDTLSALITLLGNIVINNAKNGVGICGHIEEWDEAVHVYLKQHGLRQAFSIGPLIVMGATNVTYSIARDLRSLPEGLAESELTEDDLDIVFSTSEVADKIPEMKDAIFNHIRFLPSVCIRGENRLPVAWFLTRDLGDMGMLYVHPDFRRRGLAKYVIIKLSEKLKRIEKPAFVNILPTNDISINLHKQCGFEEIDTPFGVHVYK